jgi:hypothetical protein
MSEHIQHVHWAMKKRYFQDATGHVYTSSNPQAVVPPGWTEVQVAPLDAIVIRREELPEVEVKDGWATANGGEDPYSARLDANPGWPWHYGINALAVSLYLREHPPVDPEVERQAEALWKAAVDVGTDMDIRQARRLIESGRVEVKP